MGELQLWHFIATGTLGVLMTILTWWGKTISAEVKEKLSKEDFKQYIDEASRDRRELRESIIQIFANSKAHDEKDSQRFEILTKDFNGGIARLTDLVYSSKLDLLREINSKVDK